MAVRREAVRLELEDHFTREVLAASVAVDRLKGSLNDLSGTAVRSSRSTSTIGDDIDNVGSSSRRAASDIDKLSGRLSLLARAAAVLGPAFAPLGAVGAAGIAGLASQMGFATVAAGSLVIAFQGVGDALEAAHAAHLDPTVENFQKLNDVLRTLSPQAREFVIAFEGFRPVLTDLQHAAAGGWLSGFTASLDDLADVAPRIEGILRAVSEAGGELIEGGAESLASDRWTDFFTFIENEAPQAITDLGRVVGDLAHGFTELWQAFGPLNRDFSSWMVDAASSFDRWASGLSETQGFKEFIAYVRDNGPRVAEFAAALGNAFVQIAQAAAPLGGPVLSALTALLETIAAVADSPLGTPIMTAVTAISALSLAANVAAGAVGRLNAGLAMTGRSAILAGTSSNILGLGLAGLTSGLVNAISQLQQFQDGSQGAGESFLRLLPGVREMTILQEQFGIGLEGTKDGLDDASKASVEYAQAQQAAQEKTMRWNMRMAQQRAELRAQREALRASTEGFYTLADAVEKPKFSLDDLLTRMRRQARATEDMARNMRRAIENGADPAAVKQLFDEMGTEGALAMEQLANGGKKAARQFNAAFAGTEDASGRLLRVLGRLTIAIDELSGKRARPKIEANDQHFQSRRNKVDQQLGELDGKTSKPKIDADTKGFDGGARNTRAELQWFDNRTVSPKINVDTNAAAAAAATNAALNGIDDEWVYIHVQRLGAQGIGPARINDGTGADGTRVPKDGGPYVDRLPYLLAPGERVVSNRRGQSDRSARLLDMINTGAIDDSVIGRLADGGLVMGGGGDGDWSSSGPRDTSPNFAGPFTNELRGATGGLRGLRRELRQTERALERERAQRDRVLDQMRSLGSDVSQGLTSNLWEQSNPWSSTFAGGSPGAIKERLKADIADAKAMVKAIRTLKAKGVKGAALAEILGQGGLAGAQAFASLPAKDLKEFSDLYSERARAIRSASTLAGNAAFGGALAREQADIKPLVTHLKRIEAAIRRAEKSNKDEHKKDRDSNRRGNRNGVRNGNRGGRK